MKILIFVRSLNVGGTERQVIMLARGLAARGHDVTVAQLYSGGAMEGMLEGSEARLVSMGKRSRWDVSGPLRRLRRLFLTEVPDVIYSFLPMQNVMVALLGPSPRSRLIFGVRASGMQLRHYDGLSALSYRAEAWLSKWADAIVANAECFRIDAINRRFHADKLTVIPNGIDVNSLGIDPAARRRIRQAWNIDERTLVVGMVARLDAMKDHPNFLAAAADFAKRCPGSRFVCVGGGPAEGYLESLKKTACDLGIASRVMFTGEESDVASVYNAFDIATLSSAFGEGFPNVIGEAMACGVPVVATDVGDARNIVGDCGAIVPPRRPDLLSEAWVAVSERLADEPGLRFSARGRIVDHYSVDVMVEKTERVLAQVVGGEVPEPMGADKSGSLASDRKTVG